MLLSIVYLRPAGMLLTKKKYPSWREIQDEFGEYMASLGPWSIEEIIDYIRLDYPTNPPFTEDQIRRFIESDAVILHAV